MSTRGIGVIVFFSFFLPFLSVSALAAEQEAALAQGEQVYRIKKGDTVYGISRQFSVSRSAILKRNKLKNPRALRPGKKLVIPASSSSPRAQLANPSKKSEQIDVPEAEKPQDTTASQKEEKQSIKEAFSVDTGDSSSPLYIKSDTLSLNAKERIFTYKGNVEIVRDDVKITADVMIGKYNKANKIETVVCEDNVVITRGEDLRASSDRAVYRVKTQIAELTESPELFHHGNALTADRVVLYLEEDRSEADGNVRVKVIKTDEQGEIDIPGKKKEKKGSDDSAPVEEEGQVNQ